MSVEIINYKEMNKGHMVGFVDVYLPRSGLEIHNLTYFRKDGKEWISMPSKEYTDKEGQKKYMQQVRFRDRNHGDAFGRAVIEAIRKFQPTPPTPKEQMMHEEEELPF